MGYYIDKTQFAVIEALRRELFERNPDIAERLTPGVPLLQTVGEVLSLVDIPVDLTLSHDQFVAFMWDLVEILHRRGTIIITGGKETITETVKELHADLLSEVMLEYATGIIVTQDEVVPVAGAEGEQKKLELLPVLTNTGPEKPTLH